MTVDAAEFPSGGRSQHGTPGRGGTGDRHAGGTDP